MAQIHQDYMKQLHDWQKICNLHHAMCWQYAGIGRYFNPSTGLTTTATRPTVQRRTHAPDQGQLPIPRAEFRLAPVSYRILAELMDFVILMTVKMFSLLLYVKFTGESGNSYAPYQYQFLFSDTEDDEVTIDDLRHIMMMGLVYRLLACIYEAAFVALSGATPGKMMLGLEVVSCSSCLSLQRENLEVLLVHPGTTPSFGRSWIRSLIKNFSITFLMPAFMTIFFYRHNRTSYDIVANTVVVRNRLA